MAWKSIQISRGLIRSSNFVAVGHSKQRYSVKYFSAYLGLHSLPFYASTPHVATEDRLVSVDGVLHHAALGCSLTACAILVGPVLGWRGCFYSSPSLWLPT